MQDANPPHQPPTPEFRSFFQTCKDGGRSLCARCHTRLALRREAKGEKIEQMSVERKTKMNSSFTCAITCHYSCLERNGLPHLVNSGVSSQTGEWWIWPYWWAEWTHWLSSRPLTQGRINYTGVDRESKHKCGLTARFPGWKLRRRWNNFRGATSKKSQLQRWMWTSPSPSPPSPPPPAEWGLFPEKSKTKFKFQYPLNLWRGLLNFFLSEGNDNQVCSVWWDKRLRRQSDIANAGMIHACPPTMPPSRLISGDRSFSSSLWFICFRTNP